MFPFSSVLLSPVSCQMDIFNYKKIPFKGYMKLSYLHPNIFTPSTQGIESLTESSYCIIRLAKLVAHHDQNIKGLTEKDVLIIIEKLKSKNINAYIDSEYPLSDNLKSYSLSIPKNRMHDLLAFSDFVIADSQSMIVEAAMLGIPSIRFNDFVGKIGVLNELEQVYGLTFGILPSNQEMLFSKLDELLAMKNVKEEFQQRRKRMLAEKIDVAAFMIWFIENYPQSKKIIKNDIDFQNKFC
jgi:predicted glycosyltransferase